jgi:hypothetical protein
MTPLGGWQNFYVIVGSSAGALIGLQFVVMALIVDIIRTPSQGQAGQAFATPTIVHFSTVLLLSAALSAPWSSIDVAAALWGLIGLGGLVYAAIITRRMSRQTAYKPVFEDWMFHAVLPIAAYATLSASACEALAHPAGCLFGPASAALLLLFIGIHNAWDAVTYHIFVKKPQQDEAEQNR